MMRPGASSRNSGVLHPRARLVLVLMLALAAAVVASAAAATGAAAAAAGGGGVGSSLPLRAGPGPSVAASVVNRSRTSSRTGSSRSSGQAGGNGGRGGDPAPSPAAARRAAAAAFVGPAGQPQVLPPQGLPFLLLGRRGGAGKNKGIAGTIFSSIGGLFKRVLSSLLPALGAGSSKSFTEGFEAEYGKRHPAFVEAPTLTHALNAARVAGKFLVVYLPSPSPRDDKRHRAFCRTLTDPEVIKAMKPSFLFWAPASPHTAGFKAAVKELRARRQPYLAVVHLNEKPPRKTTVRSLHHFKPPPTPEQAVVWLTRTLEIHGHALEADRQERAYLAKEAALQVEQAQEYAKAVQADRQLEEKEKREAEAKTAAEAAAKKKAAEDAARRERKRAALGAEPTSGSASAGGAEVCRIAVRLPQGTKAQRSFLSTDALEKVFDWVDVEGLVDPEGMKLVQTRPARKAFVYPEDKAQSLAEAGLSGQVLLLVESSSKGG